jgi:hypothetical protein
MKLVKSNGAHQIAAHLAGSEIEKKAYV